MTSSLIQLQGDKKVMWLESIADKFYYTGKQTPSGHFISKFKKDVMFWRYDLRPFGYVAYFIGTEEEVNNRLVVLSIHNE